MGRTLFVTGAVVLGVAALTITSSPKPKDPPPFRIVVELERPNTPDDNDAQLVLPLESAFPRVAVRSEATQKGARLVFTVPARDHDVAQNVLDAARARITWNPGPHTRPDGWAAVEEPQALVYVGATRDVKVDLARIPGVADVVACDEPGEEAIVVRLDPAKLDKHRVTLKQVQMGLASNAMQRMVMGHDLEPIAIRATELQDEPRVRVDDVASVERERARPACTSYPRGTFAYTVRLRAAHEREALAALRAVAPTVVPEASALVARVSTSDTGYLEAARLDPDVRPATTTIDRDGVAQLVFDVPAPSPRHVVRLHELTRRHPNVRWLGARGGAAKGVRHLEVVIPERIDVDFEARVHAVGDSLRDLPGVLAEIARTETAPRALLLTSDGVPFVEGIRLAASPPLPDGGGRFLPPVVRVNHHRAAIQVLEVRDDDASLRAVERAAAARGATVERLD